MELEKAGVVLVDTERAQGTRKGQLLHYRLDEERIAALSSLWHGWLTGSADTLKTG